MMLSFPDDFRWGAATSSYQVEGAVTADGRGESIWDRFTHTAGRIKDGSNGDVTCDHYHRWRDDIDLMRNLGLNAYRFSVAWPRIRPTGRGKVNPAGIDFYSRLTDELLSAGIEPAVTLYHWDLPQAMQDSGGWQNRDTAGYFTDYAYDVLDSLGDRVKRWITFNEPWVIAFLGHHTGAHAPGVTDLGAALRVSHVINLAHAKAVDLFHHDFPQAGGIGITLNLNPAYPETDEDHDAAVIHDGYFNRWFLDPPIRGAYPEDMVRWYSDLGLDADVRDGDMDLIAGANIDFLGVNYYNRGVVHRSAEGPFKLRTIVPDGAETTAMGWEVYPEALFDLLVRLQREYQVPELYITENGAAYPDTDIHDGIVRDDDRISYLHSHLEAAWRAIQEGVALRGYYLWSLLDNFEWAFGFTKRFGIVRTDYRSLDRIMKASAHWYRDVIARGGLEEA